MDNDKKVNNILGDLISEIGFIGEREKKIGYKQT